MITYNAPITGGTKDFNYKLIDCDGEISISFDVSYSPQPELPWVNVTSSDTKISISFGATEETEERTATITPKVNGESCDSQAITIIQASHCNCDIISSVAITKRIPSDGGYAGLVIGQIEINEEGCPITFSASSSDLHIITAASLTEGIIDITLESPAPSNEGQGEDTPSRQFNFNLIVNGDTENYCLTSGVTQEGKIDCSCEAVKIVIAESLKTKLPPIAIENMVLGTINTKGCGTIEAEARSNIFVDNEVNVTKDGDNYIITASINAMTADSPTYSGGVHFEYVRYDQEPGEEGCALDIDFVQYKNYCGCYDMKVLDYCESKYYTESSKVIKTFYSAGTTSLYSDCGLVEQTIPPIIYDYRDSCALECGSHYCHFGEYNNHYYEIGEFDLYDEDEDKLGTERQTFAFQPDVSNDNCRQYRIELSEYYDWIDVFEPEKIGRNRATFVKIQNNETSENREAIINVIPTTTDDGDCEPTEIRVVQRHKVSTCEEVMAAVGDYYETKFSEPLFIGYGTNVLIIGNDKYGAGTTSILDPLFVPYGKLTYEIGKVDETDEDGRNYIQIPAIWSYQKKYNANFINALLVPIGNRDQERIVNIKFKTELENGVVCDLANIKVRIMPTSSPPSISCSCVNSIHVYDEIYLPSNLSQGCTKAYEIGYSSRECERDFSGFTCDINGNPAQYNWLEVIGNGAQRDFQIQYYLTLQLLNIPAQESVAYYKSDFYDLENCQHIHRIIYDPSCAYCKCDVYNVSDTSHINTSFNLTDSDEGTILDLGYIEIGVDNDCYDLNKYACCLTGNFNSSYFVGGEESYFDNPDITLETSQNSHRIRYKCTFSSKPSLPRDNLTIGIMAKTGDKVLLDGSEIVVNISYSPS